MVFQVFLLTYKVFYLYTFQLQPKGPDVYQGVPKDYTKEVQIQKKLQNFNQHCLLYYIAHTFSISAVFEVFPILKYM